MSSTGQRTPSAFATDITNLPAASATASTSAGKRRARPPVALRQTNLAFAPRSSSPAPPQGQDNALAPGRLSSPARLSSPSEDSARRQARDVSSSLHADAPTYGEDGMDIDRDDDGDSEDQPEEPVQTSKRRKLDAFSEGAELVASWDLSQGVRKMASGFTTPGRQMSVLQALERRLLGFKASSAQVSMRPLLRDYTSSNEGQVFRCPSQHPARTWAPPFALAFSKAAKAGGKQTLVIGDEEGTLNFIDAEKENQWDQGTSHTSYQAHQNAIFDLAWSLDDQIIATASGDQTVRLFDVEAQACIGQLVGHTCTIKNVAWDPRNPNLLSTASRDGSIRIWDRRSPGEGDDWVGSVNLIKNAHGSKGKASKGRSATKSVTAVTYLPQAENLLASSGSSDGIIKVWDLRRSHSRRVNPAFIESNEEAVSNINTLRPHGISSMTLAPNGQKLYALSKDSQVYAFDPLNLTHASPLAVYSHPKALYSTFYIRVAVSPCSRFIASGSSEGGVYTWDTEGNGQDAVRMVGHEKETSGLDWGGKDRLASCSDDSLVRVWSLNSRVARQRRSKDEIDKEVGWKWSGEEA